MDGFDDEEWAEMQEMYVNHTSKELTKIQENIDKLQQEQMSALSGLMGIAMKEVRGKASGKIINQKLKVKIQKILN